MIVVAVDCKDCIVADLNTYYCIGCLKDRDCFGRGCIVVVVIGSCRGLACYMGCGRLVGRDCCMIEDCMIESCMADYRADYRVDYKVDYRAGCMAD